MVADSRTLVDKMRVEAQNYWFTYNEPIRTESVTQAVCDLAMSFGNNLGGERVMSRPFGVSLLIAGVDKDGPDGPKAVL